MSDEDSKVRVIGFSPSVTFDVCVGSLHSFVPIGQPDKVLDRFRASWSYIRTVKVPSLVRNCA